MEAVEDDYILYVVFGQVISYKRDDAEISNKYCNDMIITPLKIDKQRICIIKPRSSQLVSEHWLGIEIAVDRCRE